jgi:hypothetical protein
LELLLLLCPAGAAWRKAKPSQAERRHAQPVSRAMLLPRTPLDMLLRLIHHRNTGGTIGATIDDVYLAYTDSGYYLCDRRDASAGVAISISM